ncbi:MAG: sigma-70 family RNA polymerase sigma factor [Polyangiales bacterium]
MLAYVDGDEIAFRELFSRYAPMFYRMAMRHLRDEIRAQEIVQQTFFRIHRARNDFRRDARFKPWATTIAMNLMRQFWRESARRKTVDIDSVSIAASKEDHSPMEREERARILHGAIERLPSTQREVVELHWLQNLPFAEVAKIVGSSEGAVRVRAHRAYTTLKSILSVDLES